MDYVNLSEKLEKCCGHVQDLLFEGGIINFDDVLEDLVMRLDRSPFLGKRCFPCRDYRKPTTFCSSRMRSLKLELDSYLDFNMELIKKFKSECISWEELEIECPVVPGNFTVYNEPGSRNPIRFNEDCNHLMSRSVKKFKEGMELFYLNEKNDPQDDDDLYDEISEDEFEEDLDAISEFLIDNEECIFFYKYLKNLRLGEMSKIIELIRIHGINNFQEELHKKDCSEHVKNVAACVYYILDSEILKVRKIEASDIVDYYYEGINIRMCHTYPHISENAGLLLFPSNIQKHCSGLRAKSARK